ncbi:MAG TPA: VOC family protein [Acidimicrobiales bacterium]|nr:VOC family protein [Acidimicrobiales bacterium]
MTTREEAEGGDRRSLAHGQLAYLQIPATDVGRAGEFYGQVFGWSVEPPQPGFEAPGMIGQFVDDRPPAGDAGPMLWIAVDDLEVTLRLVRDNGGEVVELPTADGPRTLATVADPTGNRIGLAAH